MSTHCTKGALCRPPSNFGGSTVSVILVRLSRLSDMEPAVPASVEMSNGRVICQHSIVDFPLAPPMAVMFRRVMSWAAQQLSANRKRNRVAQLAAAAVRRYPNETIFEDENVSACKQKGKCGFVDTTGQVGGQLGSDFKSLPRYHWRRGMCKYDGEHEAWAAVNTDETSNTKPRHAVFFSFPGCNGDATGVQPQSHWWDCPPPMFARDGILPIHAARSATPPSRVSTHPPSRPHSPSFHCFPPAQTATSRPTSQHHRVRRQGPASLSSTRPH